MPRQAILASMVIATAVLGALAATPSSPPQQSAVSSPAEADPPVRLVTAIDPKALSEQVGKGIAWLVAHQHESGGWGQGEESSHMGNEMSGLKEQPNVADTCAAMLALIRSGSTPSKGPHADSLSRALNFVCKHIEAADADSLSITSVNGTRVQGKLGPYIDTFLASVVLAELKGAMPDAAGEERLASAIGKVVHKIASNQKTDGTWKNEGWAPLLAQSMAAKGMNRAQQNGFAVPATALVQVEGQATQQAMGGRILNADGAAGVALYSVAGNLGTLQDSVNSNFQRKDDLEKVAADASAPQADRDEAKKELDRFAQAEVACSTVQKTLIERLDDEQFIAGFGSNGGEEFLSYMNIGESLVLKNDQSWTKWDQSMTKNLNRVQNADGSWTGHHCITGRTFCTATALLVLMVDRTPVPAEAKAQ